MRTAQKNRLAQSVRKKKSSVVRVLKTTNDSETVSSSEDDATESSNQDEIDVAGAKTSCKEILSCAKVVSSLQKRAKALLLDLLVDAVLELQEKANELSKNVSATRTMIASFLDCLSLMGVDAHGKQMTSLWLTCDQITQGIKYPSKVAKNKRKKKDTTSDTSSISLKKRKQNTKSQQQHVNIMIEEEKRDGDESEHVDLTSAIHPTQSDDATPKSPSPPVKQRKPRTPHNKGGRPLGSTNATTKKHDYFGKETIAKLEKKAMMHAARNYAATELMCEQARARRTKGETLKNGKVAEIILRTKLKYGLGDDDSLKESTIRSRALRGNFSSKKSPLNQIEEQLIHNANAQIREWGRELTAKEGTQLANELVRENGLQQHVMDWKMRHNSHFPGIEYDAEYDTSKNKGDEADIHKKDGDVITDRGGSKNSNIGEPWMVSIAYWPLFLKRKAHRLENTQKKKPKGPISPMLAVEPILVDNFNALGYHIRQCEGLRMAMEFIMSTEVGEQMRKFKENVLKKKGGKKRVQKDGTIVVIPSSLLGPGYWRGFIKRNGDKLIHQKVQASCDEVLEQEQHDQFHENNGVMEEKIIGAPLFNATNAEILETQLQHHNFAHANVVDREAYEEDIVPQPHEDDQLYPPHQEKDFPQLYSPFYES